MAVSQRVRTESREVRRLIAECVRLHRSHRPSALREQALRRRIRTSLDYLDRNAIQLGASMTEVASLLGPAPGAAGADSWIYPGGVRESYRVDFQSGQVSGKSFETIRFD
jgi:hypothetical protein